MSSGSVTQSSNLQVCVCCFLFVFSSSSSAAVTAVTGGALLCLFFLFPFPDLFHPFSLFSIFSFFHFFLFVIVRCASNLLFMFLFFLPPRPPSLPQTSVTLNKHSGIITTTAATTAANGCEAFPFSNSKIAASDVIQVSIQKYSGTFGSNGIPAVSVSAISNGAATVVVCNAGAQSLSGTLEISFWVLKQS